MKNKITEIINKWLEEHHNDDEPIDNLSEIIISSIRVDRAVSEKSKTSFIFINNRTGKIQYGINVACNQTIPDIITHLNNLKENI